VVMRGLSELAVHKISGRARGQGPMSKGFDLSVVGLGDGRVRHWERGERQ
jgi:hypothetical protein